ncbi:MAG: NADH-quinone oxidoreductase subunit NuoG [Candidatus Porifericomitaceae bacterium WSBS_2022_MAG_OTU9]
MSAAPQKPPEEVEFTVDGRTIRAAPGSMLIEATDQHGINVPRFCYHSRLSVAANCRMCLVDVEKAPKPMPACATPVAAGMVVRTTSAKALDAQKAVMEFLLINHPLDCPICDQGGECELQDLAMGYGRDISRYQENKRVLPALDIGPLVQTDLTRCIQCTRCVRFGEEVAGLRELGALGRGEHMEIGTYVKHSMRSELSGNIIDLCPVGALTSKPFRYSARTWEMQQQQGIAPHDCLGSNINIQLLRGAVKRVVPAANPAINDVWLSDRDRFSYLGLYSEDRLTKPMLYCEMRRKLHANEWGESLEACSRQLRQIVNKYGADELGFIVSPSLTTEEHYLAQRLARALGCNNIDHRLRQSDFRGQERAPAFPWLGCDIDALEQLDACLLLGATPRTDVPLLNYRLRKSALKGGAIMSLGPVALDSNFDMAEQLVTAPGDMAAKLAKILLSIPQDQEKTGMLDDKLFSKIKTDDDSKRVGAKLLESKHSAIFIGEDALAHPDFYTLWQLAGLLAKATGSFLGFIPTGANAVGAALAGCLPHRGLMGSPVEEPGATIVDMIRKPRKAYILIGVEPEHDLALGQQCIDTLQDAEYVVYMGGWLNEQMRRLASIALPVCQYAENDGTYINLEGRIQSFAASASAPGETRPLWKVLRMLGSNMQLAGFDYNGIDDIQAEIMPKLRRLNPDNKCSWQISEPIQPKQRGATSAERYGSRSPYSIDPLVRRATALHQANPELAAVAMMNTQMIQRLGLGDKVRVRSNDATIILPLKVDDAVADNCINIPCVDYTNRLGPCYTDVELSQP